MVHDGRQCEFTGCLRGSIYYKPIQCPTGYIMTGTRMYGIGDGVDEEHVDAYCCPFN
ncbi:shufflon protein C' [Shigella sonnei]|nr:shufflon protein C' [Shigella sonnei]